MRAALPVLALTVALAAPAAGMAAKPRAPLDGLDTYVTSTMAAWKMPGVALAVVKGLVGGDDVHDDPALEHLGQATLDLEGARLARGARVRHGSPA
jgi:hypothetical protein